MSTFPTTTDELDEYISAYMTAHIAEAIDSVTAAVVRQAVREYMADYGAAMESSSSDGDVPLVDDDELDADNLTMPLVRTDAQGIPASFVQARVSALAKLAALYVSGSDTPLDVVQQNEDDVTIDPNVLNVWATPLSNLRIAFNAGASDKVNEYMLQFTCDANFVLEFDDDVRWAEEPDFVDGNTYQISVLDGLAICVGWEEVEET